MASDRRGLIVPFLLFAYLFLQPDPGRGSGTRSDGRPLIDDAIAHEEYSLSLLQNSTWNPDFGRSGSTLNFTGLQPEKAFAWSSLPLVKSKVKEQLQYALGDWVIGALDGNAIEHDAPRLYTNITGHVRGEWKRSDLQSSVPVPQLNLTEYLSPDLFRSRNRFVKSFQRNITGDSGHVSFSLEQKFPGDQARAAINAHYNATEIAADVSFEDATSFGEYELKLHGVYFTGLGQAILTTTTTDKFAGIFVLPHLALSEHTFQPARAILNASLSRTIQRQIDHDIDLVNPWTSTTGNDADPAFAAPECDLIVYLQQMTPHNPPGPSAVATDFLEHELRFPTGASLPVAPDLRFSMLAFSPDCGFVLESKGPPEDFVQAGDHLTGPKRAVLFRTSRQHLLLYTLALALQLYLLMRQMREANTPSTRSRISFYTIAIMALGDGFATMTFLLISLFILGLWVNLVVTGFLAFINVSFFGMRFLMDIWQVQAPERERRARAEVEEERRREEALQAAMQRLRQQRDARRRETAAANDGAPATEPAALPTATDTNAGVNTLPPASDMSAVRTASPSELPVPVTATLPVDTGATPVFMPSDQAGLEPIAEVGPINQADTTAAVQARMPTFGSLYVRFYLLLLGATFLSLHATSWPAMAQRVYFTLLALIYLSFWVPQIHRNVQRNCRHALHWEFVVGQSVLRLVPFVYFYGYSGNVLFTATDLYGLTALTLWVWIQVVALASQELIGPRWFIRQDWAPPAYDYHPILREDEEGAAMPIGFSQARDASTAPSSPIQERTPTSPVARQASTVRDTKEKGKRIFDCAICMQDLEVPVVEVGAPGDAGLAGGLLARRSYMLAPCRHIFHSSCLEGWMKYRLQCPICRETLPPL